MKESRSRQAGRARREAEQAKVRKATPQYRRRLLVTWAIVLLGVGGAGVLIAKNADFSPKCPGHWHSTFGIFVPGQNGQPEQIDFASPRSARNPANAYYQLGDDPKMGLSLHMHQSGAEQGDASLGPAQLHYETNGQCVGLADALEKLDVALGPTGLATSGGHAQVGQANSWTANGNQTLTAWIQHTNGEWQERPVEEVLDYQMKDGESVLIAFGNYTTAQVAGMQAAIPPPMSRSA